MVAGTGPAPPTTARWRLAHPAAQGRPRTTHRRGYLIRPPPLSIAPLRDGNIETRVDKSAALHSRRILGAVTALVVREGPARALI
jgi:hypothetical protein